MDLESQWVRKGFWASGSEGTYIAEVISVKTKMTIMLVWGKREIVKWLLTCALSMVPPFWSTEVCYLPLGHYKPTNKREKKKQNLNWLPYPCIHEFNPISIILTSIYALIEQNSFRLCNIPRYFSWWLTTFHGFPFFVVIYFGSYRSKSFVAYYEKCAVSYVDEFLVGFVCM
jgi:hypothetical protein